jgi:rare lipoprotein A
VLSVTTLVHAKHLPQRPHTERTNSIVLVGAASFYGNKFQGRRTANGEKFDNQALTAAHKTLPFGSKVRVTNVRNGLSVIVRINDRGPFTRGRIIDLSKAAARKVGLGHAGTAIVRLEILH